MLRRSIVNSFPFLFHCNIDLRFNLKRLLRYHKTQKQKKKKKQKKNKKQKQKTKTKKPNERSLDDLFTNFAKEVPEAYLPYLQTVCTYVALSKK